MVLALVAAMLVGGSDAPASGSRSARPSDTVARPTLTLPPDGTYGHALWDAWFDLSAYGYEQQEYFVSGNATAADGSTAPYTTRIIVFRPDSDAPPGNRDRAANAPGLGGGVATDGFPHFNGTVVLDWVNVTAQFENAVDSIEAHEMYLREGYAWVHVSAQAAGLTARYPNPLVPTWWDPARYGAIDHPGDEYSFDMFAQIANAVRGGFQGEDPMAGLDTQVVLAAGQSQSASRLTDYVTDWQASDRVIDGFLIHGTFGHDGPAASPVPVIHLDSDADVAPTAQDHIEDNVRLWEVAGTAHSGFWIGYTSMFGNGPRSQAHTAPVSRQEKEELSRVAGNYGEQIHPMLATCTLAGATMPMRYVVSSAIVHLDRWVRAGTVPPAGSKIEYSSSSPRFNRVAVDELGNALGGIRLAPIVHPVASYQSDLCQLGGVTVPLPEPALIARYGSHQAYYAAMADAVEQNVRDGFVLAADAQDLLARACDARNRFGVPLQVSVPYCTGFAGATL